MIRVTQYPDGRIVTECETEADFMIVFSALMAGGGRAAFVALGPGGNGSQKPTELQPPPAQGNVVRLNLRDGARKVWDVLKHAERLDGDQLRSQTGMDTKQLNGAMALLGIELRRATGRKFEEFFKRTRTNKDGRRIKHYVRTKA